MGHFVEVCQYGYTHSQCRCPDPSKSIRRVECDQISHAQRPKVGTHGVEYPEAPPAAVVLRFDGGDVGFHVGPFPSRRAADEWYAVAAGMVPTSSADFTTLIDPEDALDALRRQVYDDEHYVAVSCVVPDETPASSRRFDAAAIESMVGQRFRLLDAMRWDGPLRGWATVAEAEQGDGHVLLRLRITGPAASVDDYIARWKAADPAYRLALGFTYMQATATHFVGAVDLMTGCPYVDMDPPPRFARGGVL